MLLCQTLLCRLVGQPVVDVTSKRLPTGAVSGEGRKQVNVGVEVDVGARGQPT